MYDIYIHRLLFDETILVNKAQVPPTGYYEKCRLAKWWREMTLLYYHFL